MYLAKCQLQSKCSRDFCGGSVVKSLPSSAGDVSSILVGTKIPHAAGQLSLSPTTREPMVCNKDPKQTKKKKVGLPQYLVKVIIRYHSPPHLFYWRVLS